MSENTCKIITAVNLLKDNLDSLNDIPFSKRVFCDVNSKIGASDWLVIRAVNAIEKHNKFLPANSEMTLKYCALRLMTDRNDNLPGKAGEVRYPLPDGLSPGNYTLQWIDALDLTSDSPGMTDNSDRYTVYLSDGTSEIWKMAYDAVGNTISASWSKKNEHFSIKDSHQTVYLGFRGESDATNAHRPGGCLISQVSLTCEAAPPERLIFIPEHSSLSAAVGGTFNKSTGLKVIVERLSQEKWQPAPNVEISATFLDTAESAPCFINSGTLRHYFSKKMTESEPVVLPVIKAGIQPGSYQLKVFVTDNPGIYKTLELKVVRIERFDPTALSGEVVRNWTTEPGRWAVKAMLKGDIPAPDQLVEFYIDDSNKIGVKFKDGETTSLNGTTNDYGYAHVPAIIVPDTESSFKVYINAGNNGEIIAQSHVNVTITGEPTVHIIEKAGWESTDSISVLSPKSFSVRLLDFGGKSITSGKHAVFTIQENSAGAFFMTESTNDAASAEAETQDIVPACLEGGLARLTCRQIKCTNPGGSFKLIVTAKENSGISTSGTITVGGAL